MSNLISVGRHRAVCRSIDLGWTSGSSPKEQAAVHFDLVDPGDVDQGRTITTFMFFTPAALPYTVKNLRTLGWKGSDPAELPEIARSGVLATEVELVIVHDTYNGKTTAKVKYINSLGMKLANPMDDTQRRNFGSSLRTQIAALDGEVAERGGQGTFDSTGSASDPDNDIPFLRCDMSDIDPIRRSRWP